MSTIAARTIAIAEALTEHADLPHISLGVYGGSAYINVDLLGGRESVGKVAAWAQKFNTGLIISLSYYGSGSVETTVELGGHQVAIKTSVGTAEAYKLGRILQRPLSADVSIQISADELLAALAAEAVTS